MKQIKKIILLLTTIIFLTACTGTSNIPLPDTPTTAVTNAATTDEITTDTTLTATTQEPVVLQMNGVTPDTTFTGIDGVVHKLSEYRGEKVMFWFFATWCPSCIKAAEVLENNNDQLNGMKIIALKSYGNAGYKGISINKFAQNNAPDTLNYNNWVWGDASKEATQLYNTKNYPDIYFLIDEQGILRAVDGSPAATLNKILTFAQEK